MNPVRILVESMADEDAINAQMMNARDIIHRLDPGRFHISTFVVGTPDPRISKRPNTRLIRLPLRRQTPRILAEFLFGGHDLLFYVKASPASRWYMKLRSIWHDRRVTVGTVESQSNWRDESTIAPQNIALIEQTVLRCDYLFSNSKSVKRSLEAEYGLPSETVPTGVDALRTELGIAADEQVVTLVARLVPIKRVDRFLAVARVLAQRPGVRFVIVGDGIMAAEIRTAARRQPNVSFAGVLSRTSVRNEYRQADIFLFPSRWEGSPKVILEAAACGLPVIVRKHYDPETVVDGQTGYMVGEDDELFSRLHQLILSPTVRQTMGRAGRTHSENFDWGRITCQWEQIFWRLAGNRHGCVT